MPKTRVIPRKNLPQDYKLATWFNLFAVLHLLKAPTWVMVTLAILFIFMICGIFLLRKSQDQVEPVWDDGPRPV